MAIKQIDILLERLRNDPTFKAQIQSEMMFPYQSDQVAAPTLELLNPHSDKGRLEASFDSLDNLIQSFSMEPMEEEQFSTKIVNDKSLDAIKDNFTPPMAKDDFEAPDMSEEDLDAKIQEGMDKGYMDWFNTAFTPHDMDYLAEDDPSDVALAHINDYMFDKAVESDIKDDMGRKAGIFQAYEELSDPTKRRYIPNATPLEDVGDTTPAEDLAHYEEALKILQERKVNRAKALETARANMAAAAWMYRKDPSMLSALFGEKASKDLAKVNRESQKSEELKTYKKKAERAYDALSDEVQSYDKQDKDQTMLIKKLAREYRNALEDANLDERFDDDMEALGIDTKKLRKLDLDWKSGMGTSLETPESNTKPVLVSDINNFLNDEKFKDLKVSFKKTEDVDTAIKDVEDKIKSLEANTKDGDTDKAKAKQDLDNLKTRLDQRKKDIITGAGVTKSKQAAEKSLKAMGNLSGLSLTDAIRKHNKKHPNYKLDKKDGKPVKVGGW